MPKGRPEDFPCKTVQHFVTLAPMKTILFCMALVGFSSLRAQSKEIKEVPQLPIVLSGEHIEKAAKNRTTSMLLTAGAAILAGSSFGLDNDQRNGIYGVAGIALVGSIGFNISAIGHERKAGRIMQGK